MINVASVVNTHAPLIAYRGSFLVRAETRVFHERSTGANKVDRVCVDFEFEP